MPTVTHSPATLAVLAGRGDDEAFAALCAMCTAPTFDLADLEAAAGSFPDPRPRDTARGSRRSGSQAVLSGSWGVTESFTKHPAKRLRVDQHELWQATGRWVDGGIDVQLPATVTREATVTDRVGLGIGAGLTFTLTLGPGVVGLAACDLTRREASREATDAGIRATVDAAAAFLADGQEVPERVPSRGIREWSRRSRSRMVRAFASVDWSALNVEGSPLGMVTLTYPGDWLAVAPDAKTVKRHLAAFRKRFSRATGRRLDAAWKLEFQDRGAPHYHLLMPCPAMVGDLTFEHWLSLTWAGIVAADWCGSACYRREAPKGWRGANGRQAKYLPACCERGRHVNAGTGIDFSSTGRMSDPKRLAVYFLKHGTKSHDGKEYQHNVPEQWLTWVADDLGELHCVGGAGRFWGFWGLKPATVALDLDAGDFITVKRALRRVAAARARATAYSRAKHDPRVCRCHRSEVCHAMGAKSRSHVLASSRMVGGFVVVNDGVRLAGDLARWVNLSRLHALPAEPSALDLALGRRPE